MRGVRHSRGEERQRKKKESRRLRELPIRPTCFSPEKDGGKRRGRVGGDRFIGQFKPSCYEEVL